jgi:nucleotide-binding universal stress UspA family protein
LIWVKAGYPLGDMDKATSKAQSRFKPMKTFLVPIGGSDTDEAVLKTALAAARPFAAHLQFLHVRVGVGEAAQHTPHMGFASGAALREAMQELETQSHDRSVAALQYMIDFCARSEIEFSEGPGRSPSVTASCREEKGAALDRIMFHARHSDLVVIGRSHQPNGWPSDFLESLLLGCGRPVLIASATPSETVTGTIMVCWRESADAARAVTAAAPFLTQAKRVVFVGVAEKSEDTAAALDDVVRQFAWCGVPAAVQVITPNGRPVHELLATAAQRCAADLVVSGAYGHSHLRELLFSGCTQSFIRHSDRPILLMR